MTRTTTARYSVAGSGPRELPHRTRGVATIILGKLNELYLFAKENVQSGLTKSGQDDFLDGIISGSQQIVGLLGSVMYRDGPGTSPASVATWSAPI